MLRFCIHGFLKQDVVQSDLTTMYDLSRRWSLLRNVSNRKDLSIMWFKVMPVMCQLAEAPAYISAVSSSQDSYVSKSNRPQPFTLTPCIRHHP